jgi:hypothetical protein
MESKYIFFNPVACCFLYKAKELSAPLYCFVISLRTIIISETIYRRIVGRLINDESENTCKELVVAN